MAHEICPNCGKKTLRFRKRTRDYTCKDCPFEGGDNVIAVRLQAKERAVAEARREFAVRDACWEVLHTAETFAQRGGSVERSAAEVKPNAWGTGLLATVIAGPISVLGAAWVSTRFVNDKLGRDTGALAWLVLSGVFFLITFNITNAVVTAIAESSKEADVRADDESRRRDWDAAHPEAVKLRELQLSSLDPEERETFELVLTVARQAVAGDPEASNELAERLAIIEADRTGTSVGAHAREG
ncbi:MAG: hypothetical protein ACHREM_26865 [Polyangiales bacterium]